jgi:hypothetical protein
MAAHSSPLEIVLARIGVPPQGCFDDSAQRRGPERMRLPLDILEGQNFARKNHNRVGPRRAGASELPAVDALDSDGSFFPLEIILAQIGLGRRVFYHTPGAGARRACAWRSIFWKAKTRPENHHGVGSRCAGASELASVDALDREGQFVGIEIVLTEIGCRPPPCRRGARRHHPKSRRSLPPSMPSKSSSPNRGCRRGVCTTPPGAGARRACAWRSIFWKAKTSPGKITTASDHVAQVHRSTRFITWLLITVLPLRSTATAATGS